eukprot:CAMPEP_0179205364 /NCGR_PEP_ID=MMETSP0796-20121207/102382_1 /TAXON_ID=73915 /ORGANISM="Pyrodinium bahamense, Strain pbaha01" /LENGTH=63 /DNA_ID=CAMNT_0020910253 /DNA_START=55 /DNA_END=243 /DNA_ORIENTATION=+
MTSTTGAGGAPTATALHTKASGRQGRRTASAGARTLTGAPTKVSGDAMSAMVRAHSRDLAAPC